MKQILIDTVAWGFALWVLGFALGMMLFPFVPVVYLGLLITPIYLAAAIWVCIQKFKGRGNSIAYLLGVGFAWFLVAFVFDYIFLVQAFAVENYYDYDVLFYYLITLALPLIVGRWHERRDPQLPW
ncbi:hypothetical protein A3A39_00030 [Candidatus Kaiserbacteria bacterium RIFCSPLOWO2_01_FULL_54_13]|uniref:Major facilitator superfamily (MFS) profile domain-containing protein n=1 Tax=Candidatus Kaiserbacteria bacterium RIFCSPLOWO2_01_FULL_54_13 TaxID=1798512 RepID=A0A1F6F0F7_9BACT|nr:MAG: hypothetical protein A3A39_00030 [Candidatus Kaiserbacteria bacterium RIFCSPLOWO2_01_FULL_54_13]